MWNGPSTVDWVAPAAPRSLIVSTSIEMPSTSDSRMNSCRTLGALLAGRGEELDRLLPLGEAGFHLAHGGVQVPDQAVQDGPQPLVRRAGEALDDRVRGAFFGEIGGHVLRLFCRSRPRHVRCRSLSGLITDLIACTCPSEMSKAITPTRFPSWS